MANTQHPVSPKRRTFVTSSLGLAAIGPLGLAGCGGATDSTADAAQALPRKLGGPSDPLVHPGLLHTQADFDRISAKVANQVSPWIDDWNLMLQNGHANNAWTPVPQAVVYRNDGIHGDNVQYLQWDIMAAYLNALQWKITGNITAANTAVKILNAWSAKFTGFGTSDGHWDSYLAAGLQGYQFANVAEIMRTYSGWAAADIAACQQMLLNVWYPWVQNDTNLKVFSNWNLCALAANMAISVFCDDRAKFEQAVAYFKEGLGNGALPQMVYYIHPGHLGQTQESGRDQGHNMLSIALVTTICEMAWNQGVDLYGHDNNRVLAACEYSAKGNLIESGATYYAMPFVPYYVPGFYASVFSSSAIGNKRPAWALIHHHYVNRMGLAAPYTKKFAELVAPEQGGQYRQTGGAWDQLGYGTLLFTRDPIATGAAPSGLTAVTTAGQTVLSWWGGAYATSYTVKRATVAGGPYAVIASGITDLLTYTDGALQDGTYYYVVTASTPQGESAPSNEVQGYAGARLHTQLAFDEGTGATAADSSGNGHAATLAGGAAWAPGKGGLGTALALNGGGAYASLPANVVDTVGDFTIAAWVYWNGNQTWSRIFDFGSNQLHYMFLSPRTGRGSMGFVVTLNGGDSEFRIDAPTALPASQWVHVAVTLSGKTFTMYLNGVAIKTVGDLYLPPFQVGHTTQNWLGRSQYAGDPTFNGKLDDFRIYHGAASAADIATLAGSVLPAAMLNVDVGAVGAGGSATCANGVYTVAGSGADIWGNSDAFQFASSCITGDSVITARVASQANTNGWAKSGVMMRTSLDANAQHVMLAVTPGNGAQMMFRSSTGGNTSTASLVAGIAAPYWVRLARSGNAFTGFISPDGVNWTQVGSITVNMPATVFSGLAVLSHNNPSLNTTTFDNVTYA